MRTLAAVAAALLFVAFVGLAPRAAQSAAIFYDLTVVGGQGSFSVEEPADPVFSGLASLLSFQLTADFEAAFPITGEVVELNVTLADFDSPADQPQASFDSGVVTHLEVNGGSGSVFDANGDEYSLQFFFADNEANLQAFRLVDSVLFDACCSFTVALAEGPPDPAIPEPAAATAFALGVGVVSLGLRRHPA